MALVGNIYSIRNANPQGEVPYRRTRPDKPGIVLAFQMAPELWYGFEILELWYGFRVLRFWYGFTIPKFRSPRVLTRF